MKVLSLFDGMSCGRIALDRAGIPVTQYYASELDKYAIKVAKANWPETIQLGDVTQWRDWDIDWSSIDLLIGGSPCQGFSFAGKQLAFDDPRSKLFFVYVDILNHIRRLNPSVKFMLENVKMKREHIAVISEQLGVEPVFINSSLASAQNRQRYYWANWGFGKPDDKAVLLIDVLEKDADDSFYCTQKAIEGFERRKEAQLRKGHGHGHVVRSVYEKSPAITSRYYKDGKDCLVEGDKGLRKLTPLEIERLQTVPEGYTAHVSNTQRYKMLGNGWTVDVIAHIFRAMLN